MRIAVRMNLNRFREKSIVTNDKLLLTAASPDSQSTHVENKDSLPENLFLLKSKENQFVSFLSV